MGAIQREIMDVRAAVAVEAGKPLEVTTVQLGAPKPVDGMGMFATEVERVP